MDNLCMYCKEPVEDFEPIFCCNGYMCGCHGEPIDPPMHKTCSAIALLEGIKKSAEKKSLRLGMCVSQSKVELNIGTKVITNDNLTSKEAFDIIGLFGEIQCLTTQIDFIIEKLKSVEK